MKHSVKSVELVQLKALGPADGEPEGTFEAIVAVFGNVDKVGDRVKSTAFDRTLADWRTKSEMSGARIPVIMAHDWANPMSYVGSADPADVKAIPGRGLYVKGLIEHMDTNPVAMQVYNLMKSQVLTEFSFGYSVPSGGQKKAADGAMDLEDVNLFEFGPCLRGINPDTELLGVKALRAAVLEEAAVKGNKFDRKAAAAALVKAYVELEMDGSYEDTQEDIQEALEKLYPTNAVAGAGWVCVNVIATFPDHVVYQVTSYGTAAEDGFGMADDEPDVFQATYSIGEDDVVTLGTPEPMEPTLVPAGTEKAATPELTKAELEELGKAWDGAASNYTDSEYAKACVLDRAIGDASLADATAKERYGLPIASPGNSYASDPDAAGCAAAATRISGVKASSEAVATAAKRLARAYDKLGNEVPAGVADLAKAEQLENVNDTWIATKSAATMKRENDDAKSVLERTVWEQSIDATEASLGPMSADALHAARLDAELTQRLLDATA